jgi:hypothetical protein
MTASVVATPYPLYRLSLGTVALVSTEAESCPSLQMRSEDEENGLLFEWFETQGVVGWQEWLSQT